MPNSIRTRLTLATAALLTGIASLVIGGIYLATVFRIEAATRDAVHGELDSLVRSWQAEGTDALIAEVERRSVHEGAHGFAYLVTDRERIRISGNVRRWPEDYGGEGHARLPVELRRADVWVQRDIHLEAARLDENRLLVGRDDFREAAMLGILRVSALGGIALASLLAVAAGLLVSRNLLRRVEAMRAKIGEILGGAAAVRIEVGTRGDEFDELASRFNHLLDENDRLIAQVREATSNIAHDLRTPLQRMHARLEAALARPRSADEARATFEALAGDSQRLLETFNGLLQIASIEAHELRRAFRSVPLVDLVQDVVELYGPLAEEAGIAIDVSVEPALVVKADRQILGQALANLVDNAIKYAAGGGSLEVEARTTDAGVEIRVGDRGPGVPEKDRARVLDRLVRLDISRGVPGTGLGLSFVAAAAHLHGGTIRLCDNEPGLRVVLTLPSAHSATDSAV
jgi:signal transduction histidine kinase